MVFAFEATPVVESGSHFNGGSGEGTGGSGEGTGGSGGNNPNIEPETCPDKQVWRQKEDGTYGCVCRHDYEYGEDCTRCEPPRSWNQGNQSCQCPADKPIWEYGVCNPCHVNYWSYDNKTCHGSSCNGITSFTDGSQVFSYERWFNNVDEKCRPNAMDGVSGRVVQTETGDCSYLKGCVN